MIEELKTLLLRDLAGLRHEVDQYPDDASLWRVLPGIANPGGNLALHLAGNLQHFIGCHLGRSGYVRDREQEFSARGLTRAQVLHEVDAAAAAVARTLDALAEPELDLEFPVPMAGKPASTRMFLVHLCAHLGYHLGQLNYHRRLAQ